MRRSIREPETGRFRASVRALVPAIVSLVLAWIIFAFVVRFVLEFIDSGTIFGLYGDVLFQWLPVLVISFWLVLKLDRQSLRAYGFALNRRWVSDLVAGILITIVSLGIAWTVGYGRGTIAIETELQPQVETPTLFVFLTVGVLVNFFVQNVYEEFIYRSLMIRNFAEGARARGLSVRLAIIVATVSSLLLFGLYHLPRGFIVVVDSIFVGIAFAVPYLLTGSLALSIGVHFGRVASSFLVVGDGYGGSALLEDIGLLTLQTDGFALFAVVWIVVAVGFVFVWVKATRGELCFAENVYKRHE